MNDDKISISPAKCGLTGVSSVPGDKSISHRAAILGSISAGTTVIHGFLTADDCLNTLNCLNLLGADIKREGETVTICGVGDDGFNEPDDILDAGNSGTLLRLMLGTVSGHHGTFFFTGDSSIRKRPMGRVTSVLRQMGATFFGRQNANFAPLCVIGSPLSGIEYELAVPSAQVKSAVMLAGLNANGYTTIVEPVQTRDHTERMISSFGGRIIRDGAKIIVQGKQTLQGCEITVPGDISSAAFFLVAGTIIEESELVLVNVGINPTRNGIIKVLQLMGADIELQNVRSFGHEPVADIKVRHSRLKGIEIGGDIIPNIIDEIPAICVAAACAEGTTVISGASELRVKESDRIATTATELSKAGVCIKELADGLIIEGNKSFKAAKFNSHGDHRIAMSMAIAALKADSPSEISDIACVSTSFPGFFNLLDTFFPT